MILRHKFVVLRETGVFNCDYMTFEEDAHVVNLIGSAGASEGRTITLVSVALIGHVCVMEDMHR